MTSIIKRDIMESNEPTPYAVKCLNGCNNGKLVFLTKECYNWQMNNPNQLWRCPRCLSEAIWNDTNYEKYYPE